MASWFHAAVLATALVATVAVGLASAAMLSNDATAPRGDRLATVVNTDNYQTIETRSADGSVLARVLAD